MSAKKQALGRGFDALIPTDLLDESFDPTASQDEKVSELRHVSIAEIDPNPHQPRQDFDDVSLAELASSIKIHGVLQPVILTPQKGRYMIVAGERRYRASKLAGITKIPALVRTLGDQHKLELSLIENIQREQLNVMETATAYLKLRDQFNLSIDEIGARVGGKSQSAVSNTLRLLKLPRPIQKALSEGKLTEGQARPLINIDEKFALALLPKIINENWSARKIEAAIAKYKKGEVTAKQVTSEVPTPYKTAAHELTRRLNADVSVRTSKRGSGTIAIKFKNEDEFKRIQQILELQ